MDNIKGIIFDIGGVLYIGEKPISGAKEILKYLKNKYSVRFLTNTTRRKPSTIYKKLLKMGFDTNRNEIFTALDATKNYVQSKNGKIYPILTDEALTFMSDIVGDNPNFVVVGDAFRNFTYDRLNIAFRYILNGATLIAGAKNRYFKDTDGELSLDMGGFVEALEFATNKKALIIGKPAKEFFLEVIKSMNLKPSEVAMVGDDIYSDIWGAQNVGIKAILVKSGKFKESDLKGTIKPDLIIEDISKLQNYF